MNDSTFEGWFALIVILFICIGSIVPLNILTRQGGEHTGYITAVEDNTFLNNGHTVYVKTELSSSQEDKYCVLDSEVDLIKKLKGYARSKDNVLIQFNSYSFTGIGVCSGDRIFDVEPLTKK